VPRSGGMRAVFFYCSVLPGKIGERLPAFNPLLSSGRLGSDELRGRLTPEVMLFCKRLSQLVQAGLMGMDLFSLWRLLYVQPMQARSHKLCEWSGLNELTQIVTSDLPMWELHNWLRIRQGFAGTLFPSVWSGILSHSQLGSPGKLLTFPIFTHPCCSRLFIRL
jgi:hypothetical protein